MFAKWCAIAMVAASLFAVPAVAEQRCHICGGSGGGTAELFYDCYVQTYNPALIGETPEGVLATAYFDVRANMGSDPSYLCSLGPPSLGALYSQEGPSNGAYTQMWGYSYSYVTSRRFGVCEEPRTVNVSHVTGITCNNYPHVVGFFNGVWNTRKQASEAITELRKVGGASFAQSLVRYELFYNHSMCGVPTLSRSCLEDLIEVFAQRSGELEGVATKRWELFWDVVSGRYQDPTSSTRKMFDKLGRFSTRFQAAVEATAAAVWATYMGKVAELLNRAPTSTDMAEHNAQLESFRQRQFKMVLVAHSQGNLFLNHAYDTLRQKTGVVLFLQAFHIAPASPSTRGVHVLANIDRVINGLRLVGGVPPNNIELAKSAADEWGHELINTYLDPSRPARERVETILRNLLARSATPTTGAQ